MLGLKFLELYSQGAAQAARLFVCSKYKEMYGNIEES